MSFTAAELKERQGFIGASESAPALGMSDWFTRVQLWEAKVNGADPIETTLPMMVGTALEPVTLALFERESGLKVINQQLRVSDPTWPIRRATLDGMTEDGALIEAKTSGDWRGWGEEEDSIPVPYMYQIMHQFACVPDAKECWVPVIIGGRTFKIYHVNRDDEFIDLMKQGERGFWMHVESKSPPQPISADDLKILYPKDRGVTVLASIDIERAVYDLVGVKKQIKELEATKDALDFPIREFFRDAATLVGSNGETLATFKGNDVNRIDTKKFRADHPALADHYTKTSHERKLLLKV